MIRATILAALMALVAFPAMSVCAGRDIIAEMPASERADLIHRAAAQPYPRGNLWRAERAGQVIHVVGTFHIGDPRLAPLMERLAPLIAESDMVYVETTPEQEAGLARAMQESPALAFAVEGTALRDHLDDAEWRRYLHQMERRGIPARAAGHLRPWVAFTTLSIPACILDMEPMPMRGLDERIIDYARELRVPVRGLEDDGTLFSLFDTLTQAEAADILRATLQQSELSEDVFATLAQAYFNEQHRLIWEFSRGWSPPGAAALFAPEYAQSLFDRLEEALLLRRNRDWIAGLAGDDAAEGRLMLAVGAAHLGGHDGVLDLLARAGYRLTRLEFEPARPER